MARPGSNKAAGIRRIAWFDTREPLRGGRPWGQQHFEAVTDDARRW